MIAVPAVSLEPEKQTNPTLLVGSQIAGRDYVKAMLRYLPPGNVALLALKDNVDQIRRDIDRLQQNATADFAVPYVVGRNELAGVLGSDKITALHSVKDASLHTQAYLRNQFGSRPFPVTSLIHGLSHQSQYWSLYARILLTPSYPCDAIICTSQSGRNALNAHLEEVRETLKGANGLRLPASVRLEVIPLGVDSDLYCPRDKRLTRYTLGLPQDSILLLYFGRIDHVSKADLGPLLIALQELVKRHGSKVSLVLAGSFGSEHARAHVESMVRWSGCGDQVIVRPQPSAIEGPLYYAAADIFVSPVDTLQETFGISPLEAMSSGLPVVVSGWSGYRETVQHGRTGFLVPSLWADCANAISDQSPLGDWEEDHMRVAQTVAVDVELMIDYLNVLISRPAQRNAMGEAARRHIEEQYDWKHIMSTTHDLWRELDAVSRSLDVQITPSRWLDRTDYFKTMHHYATTCLIGSEVLGLTERGKEASSKSSLFLRLPFGMESHLDCETMLLIIRFVRLITFIRMRPTLQDVTNRLSVRRSVPAQYVTRHIMWLLKYGYLRVSTEDRHTQHPPLGAEAFKPRHS